MAQQDEKPQERGESRELPRVEKKSIAELLREREAKRIVKK